MGLTCKPIGKDRSTLAKLDNALKAKAMARGKMKKSKQDRKVQKDTDKEI